MPLYEYYCQNCDRVFEALRSLRDSDQPARCSNCGGEADRMMPTTFASMSFKQGYAQRVPFHQSAVRSEEQQRTIALVKPKAGAKPRDSAKRKQKTKGGK